MLLTLVCIFSSLHTKALCHVFYGDRFTSEILTFLFLVIKSDALFYPDGCWIFFSVINVS